MQIDIGIPNAKQDIVLRAKQRHIAFGGARGGGKSWMIRAKAVLLSARYPGISIMIIRRTYPELTANHIRPLKRMLGIGTPGSPIKYSDKDKIITFPNGSTILFGYCQTDSDTDRYQGTEVDVLFLDEATQLSEQQISDLNACVRGTGDYPRRTYYTCNPGGKGHGYIKRLFVDKKYFEDEYPEDYFFVQSLVYDNATLMEKNPEYIRALESLPEARKKAWLYGDWDAFVGQAFPEFTNDSAHYSDRIRTHVIDDIKDIPQSWKIYRGFDFGYSKPFSVLWFALDHDGRLWMIKEWYGCVKGEANVGLMLTPQEIADGIKDREQADPRLSGRTIYGIADPAIWESSHGESIAEMMERCGVYFNKADNARITGKMQLHYRLMFDKDGIPMLYICKSCSEFIRTLPLLIYDDKKVEDIDTDLEDHAYDACRYVLMEHPLNPLNIKKRYTADDPLPPEDPLDIIKPVRRS